MALPEDVGSDGAGKADGVVELPLHIHWSHGKKLWDLDDRRQRAQVYEIVLSEGTDDDVRTFIDIDQVVGLWDEMWLAPHVRRAWALHLRRLRGADLWV